MSAVEAPQSAVLCSGSQNRLIHPFPDKETGSDGGTAPEAHSWGEADPGHWASGPKSPSCAPRPTPAWSLLGHGTLPGTVLGSQRASGGT